MCVCVCSSAGVRFFLQKRRKGVSLFKTNKRLVSFRTGSMCADWNGRGPTPNAQWYTCSRKRATPNAGAATQAGSTDPSSVQKLASLARDACRHRRRAYYVQVRWPTTTIPEIRARPSPKLLHFRAKTRLNRCHSAKIYIILIKHKQTRNCRRRAAGGNHGYDEMAQTKDTNRD